jgi:hypothetical protein
MAKGANQRIGRTFMACPIPCYRPERMLGLAALADWQEFRITRVLFYRQGLL